MILNIKKNMQSNHEMGSLKALAALCLVLAALYLTPTRAQAADEHPCQTKLSGAALQNYNKLESEGVTAFKAKNYSAAIQSFETALALCDQSQSLVFAMGRAYHLSGDCLNASKHYKAALLLTGKKMEDIKLRLNEANKECSDRPGLLEITCIQPGVMVSVNGAPPVACPHSAELKAGPVSVFATGQDLVSRTENSNVEANQTTKVLIPMLAEDGASGFSIAGWSTAGAGAVTLITGGVLYGMAESLRSEVTDAKDAALENGQPVDALSREDALAKQDDADTFATAGAICFGIGGAALATGALLLILDDVQSPSGNADAEGNGFSLHVSPWFGAQGGGFGVGGQF